MYYELKSMKDTCVVKVARCIETYTDCGWLRDSMVKLVDQGFRTIVLDFCDLEFMTASFCGYLVSIYKKAREEQVALCLVVPAESSTLRVLAAAGFDGIVDIYQNLDVCLKSKEWHNASRIAVQSSRQQSACAN